jgi:hypothetical protein
MAGIKILYFWQKRQCDKFLSHCCIHVVRRSCAKKFGWLTWVQGMKNSWIHHCCGDDHGCRWFFMMTVDALFGDNPVYPHDTQNQTMSRHFLMMPPWCDIGRIYWSLMLKECISLQMEGSFNSLVRFFSIWHLTATGCLAMNSASQKGGVECDFLLLSRYIVKNLNSILIMGGETKKTTYLCCQRGNGKLLVTL